MCTSRSVLRLSDTASSTLATASARAPAVLIVNYTDDLLYHIPDLSRATVSIPSDVTKPRLQVMNRSWGDVMLQLRLRSAPMTSRSGSLQRLITHRTLFH